MRWIIAILLLAGCAKEPMPEMPEPVPTTVCYECQVEGGTVYFLNTSPKEMQLVIRAWDGRGVVMECNEMECDILMSYE